MPAALSFSGLPRRFALAVHGGAGAWDSEQCPAAQASCAAAARAGHAILSAGGSALDAVQCAVELLEDDPLFNAGTGASLNSRAELELDAAIMQGRGFRAGAVCALSPFRHPIAVARRVLEDGKHVLYAGPGADAFARESGFVPEVAEAMISAAAHEKLERALGQQRAEGGNTVGAVALDAHGDVAAATSTGGTSAKAPGRVGDSPLLGAGTYAEFAVGAASATGHGEGIMKVALTLRALEAVRAGATPGSAATIALELMEASVGSTGGLIVVARDGRLGVARTSAAMPWAAFWDNDGTTSGS